MGQISRREWLLYDGLAGARCFSLVAVRVAGAELRLASGREWLAGAACQGLSSYR